MRVLAGTAAAAAALALAGPALASFSPKLVVAGPAGGPVRVGVVVAATDDPTARATIYVPAAYPVATPAPGTKLGDVTATASSSLLAGAILPLTGELDAVAATPSTDAIATQCGVSPAQTWDLHVSAAGQTLDVPLFVAAPTAAEAAAGFGAKLVVCLPPPDTASFGATLRSATFTSSAIRVPTAAADYRWTSLWTPYVAGTGTPNAAGTVEAQALQRVPLTLLTGLARRRVVSHRTVRAHGKRKRVNVVATVVAFDSGVTENGTSPGSVRITTTARGRRLGGAKGVLELVGLRFATLRITAVVDSDTPVPTGQTAAPDDLFFHDLGGPACTPTTLFGGVPCVDVTLGGARLTRSVVVRAYTR